MSKHYSTATARLKADYLRIKRDPVPYVNAEPLPSNILEWHYVVKGPEDSPYEGGYYHGKLVFPPEYPFRPPSIYMMTPSGRFKTNTRLCLSISDFHPDTWNPAWSVSTILTGLLSFMLEKSSTFGSIETYLHEKRELAFKSLAFNLKSKSFTELFPELTEEMKGELLKRKELSDEKEAHSGSSLRKMMSTNGSNTKNICQFYTAISNILVIAGFALFAWTVKYVISTTSDGKR